MTQIVPELVARILAARGMPAEEMTDFVYPDYDRDTHDPFLLTDMTAAVERIGLAAERGEQVAVYGDYDIDGITASAVMLEALAALGITARSYIPDRFEEGYGINRAALAQLQSEGIQLVISVDCGITSVSEAAWAREHGLDLIITDHHAPPAVLPVAIAVINPKRPDDSYPFKDLAGVGVAFKLVQALQARFSRPAVGQEKWLLDLVALGTVCDVVTLVGENRVLASFGLRVLRRTRRVGIRALAAVGGAPLAGLTAYHLGFVLGPRMNAAGRLEHAARSLELMMTADRVRAAIIADQLEELNSQRRADQTKVFEAADREAEAYADDPVLVLAHADWSHGIVGIVASKMVEKWQRPVLIAQIMGETVKGSARSIPGFNMVEALRSRAELFTKFGGHFFAAGYTLPLERVPGLRAGLRAYHEALGPLETVAVPEPDIAFTGLGAVDWTTLDELALLEPHGSGNPRPRLNLRGTRVERITTMGRDAQHLRLSLRDEQGRRLVGVGFGLASRYAHVKAGAAVALIGELNKNEYQGNASIQLIIESLAGE